MTFKCAFKCILNAFIKCILKMHFRFYGTWGKIVKKFVIPKIFPNYLQPLNTVVCKQKNSWLGKYKYSLKHMSMHRFNFFVYIICDEYNQLNIENKLGFILNHDISEKSDMLKRKLDEIENSLIYDLDRSSEFFSETSDSINETKRIKYN